MKSLHPGTFPKKAKTILSNISTLAVAGAIALGSANGYAATNGFGPDNPI
jgi:hypothetical protein